VSIPLFIGGCSLLFACGPGVGPWFTGAAFSGSLLGFYGFLACFWAMPGAILSESAAAAAIGAINLIGSVGGFVGPYLVGYLRTRFGSFALPLGVLGVTVILGGLVAITPRVPRTSELAGDLIESRPQPVS
jgi:ACS family tartrate transporter-like MFS transporter